MRKVMVAVSVLAIIGLIAWSSPGMRGSKGDTDTSAADGTTPAKEGVQWITLQQAQDNYKKLPKPILIDLYTDWCGWCKVMDKETYANKQVAAYIMDKFYPVKLNAEQKQAISYQGKTYQFNSNYRTHEFAIYLTGGRLSYPTTVIIPGTGNHPQPIAGFLKPNQIEPIVKYFGEGQFGKIPYSDYEKNLKKVW